MQRLDLLISAGPTREFFDSVRFISNPSSGKMGLALAAVGRDRGHKVTLVLGPISLPPPPGVAVRHVVSAAEMLDACVQAFESCDAAIMTAAVCDYRPAVRLPHKLKKKAEPLSLLLEPTTDICAHLGHRKGRRVVVGFAMEDHDSHRFAEEKLAKKRCDLMVLNGLANVGAQEGEIEILDEKGGWGKPFRGTKLDMAMEILIRVENRIDSGRESL